MREFFEAENRAGYATELEERLALAGAVVVTDATMRALERHQVGDTDDEDLDEDELEDAGFFDRVPELEPARESSGDVERPAGGDVAEERE